MHHRAQEAAPGFFVVPVDGEQRRRMRHAAQESALIDMDIVHELLRQCAAVSLEEIRQLAASAEFVAQHEKEDQRRPS